MKTPLGPGPFVMSSDTLAGDTVTNHANEPLGTIAHVMIDMPSGCIAYVVLACGGVYGIGERLFAIPWAAFTFDPERLRLVMNLEKSQLDSAPGFDSDHWPPMADPQWAATIHDYYGVRPYWAAGPRPQ